MKNPNLKENESDNMIRHKSSHKGIFSSLLALTFMGPLAVKAETDFDKIADQRCFAEEPATITDLKIEKILAYDKYTSVNIQPLFRSNDELMSMSVWRASSTDPDVESTIDIYKNMEKMTVWIPSKDVWESLHYAESKTIDNKSASIVEVIPGKTFYVASSPAGYIRMVKNRLARTDWSVFEYDRLNFSGGSSNIVKIGNTLYTVSSDGDLQKATLTDDLDKLNFISLGNFGKALVSNTFLQLMIDSSLTWTTGDGKIINYNPRTGETTVSSLKQSSPLWGKFSATSNGNFIFTQRADKKSASTDVVLTNSSFQELARLNIGETLSAARLSRIAENRYAIPGPGGQAIVFDSNLKLVRPITTESTSTGRFPGSSQIVAVPGFKDTFIYTDPSGFLRVIDSSGNIKMRKKIGKDLGPMAISSSGAIVLMTSDELIWAKLEMIPGKERKITPCPGADGPSAVQNLSESPETQPATSQPAPSRPNGSNVPKVELYDP